MPRAVVISDDLTGAADTGAGFASAGLAALVALMPDARQPECDVLVVSTESRHLPADEAAAATQAALRRLQQAGALEDLVWIYKKIDSTLRGQPGAELAATMHALGLWRALVAPAFPAQGRTTRAGRQLVDGVPLELTSFGREVPSSDLRARFQAETSGRPVHLIELETVRRGVARVACALAGVGEGIVIADAVSDADLISLARAAQACGVRLLCGSAGLARALTDLLAGAATPRASSARLSGSGPILVVAGSRHARTARQVEKAARRGVVILCPGPEFLAGDDRAAEDAAVRAAAALTAGRHVILTTAGLDDSPLGGLRLAGRLARLARRLALECHIGGLVLTGGDIAAAACAALEAPGLWLRGEVEPGVPWGRLSGGLQPDLPIVTKAGGFGSDGALAAAIDHLAGRYIPA